MKDDLDNQFAKTATRVILAISTGILVVVLAIWSMFIFTAPKASDYTKEKALEHAKPYLKEFSLKKHISLDDFEGPVFQQSLGQEFPTYVVCYKNKHYIFCFEHWMNTWYYNDLSLPHEPYMQKHLDELFQKTSERES
ncbi:MAG: hypothetical protein AB7P76_10975 [Candidatus Melainabacteria bacterium]